MPTILLNALRTGAKAIVGYAVTWLAARGIALPLEAQVWLVEFLIVGVGITAWAALVRWLETRTGTSLPARAARRLAGLLMFGLTGRQPVYAPRGAIVQEVTTRGSHRLQ